MALTSRRHCHWQQPLLADVRFSSEVLALSAAGSEGWAGDATEGVLRIRGRMAGEAAGEACELGVFIRI